MSDYLKQPMGNVRQSRPGLAEIRGYMERHFNEPLTVTELAAMGGITPKYFGDLFTRTYGQSVIDFLTDLRINRAKRYLTETKYRLREIAQMVGYSDEFYFSRKFKKEVGVSPSAFVQSPRNRIAVCSPSLMGQLLALDIVPAAAPLDSKWTPYYYNAYQSRLDMHLHYGARQSGEHLSQLVKLRPDAIVGYEPVPDDAKRKLEGIAPTLLVSKDADWRKQLRAIASFTGSQPQAEGWIDGFEQRVRLARPQIKLAVQADSFMVLRVYGKSIHAYCNRSILELLYGDLQLLPAYRHDSVYNVELTLKQLLRLNPGRMLVMVCPEMESRAYWLSLQHHAEWKSLKAVRKGQVYPVPSDPWCEYSAVAMNRMLDEMQLLLTGYCPKAGMDKVHGERVHSPL